MQFVVTSLIVTFSLITVTCYGQVDVNISDFGAKGDGTTINTAYIQEAIDHAHENNGGRVVVPKGNFLTGSIILKDGVELFISKNATILGSTRLEDYKFVSNTLATYHWKALILADSAANIRITGKGVINGQGKSLALKLDSLFYAGQLDSSLYQLKERRPVGHIRPMIIQFVNCRQISIQDVTIKNAASWVQSYDLCQNLSIDNIRVESVDYWNNDGIDIIDCKNVRITNSFINSSDDGICLKSYRRRDGIPVFCENIYIANCTVRSSASAVKLGTSSYGGFKNITIEKIKVFDTYRSAIAIESWESGVIEDILIQDIVAKNTGNALFIKLSQRDIYKNRPAGVIRNVLIRNIKASIPFTQPDYFYTLRGPTLPFFHNTFPASITGMPSQKIENVVLENIKISYPGRGNKSYANMPTDRIDEIPEMLNEYPEFSMFGELPAWGLYVRHVDGLVMNNIHLKIRKPDYRPCLVFDDTKGLKLNDIKIRGVQKVKGIFLHDSEQIP